MLVCNYRWVDCTLAHFTCALLLLLPAGRATAQQEACASAQAAVQRLELELRRLEGLGAASGAEAAELRGQVVTLETQLKWVEGIRWPPALILSSGLDDVWQQIACVQSGNVVPLTQCFQVCS